MDDGSEFKGDAIKVMEKQGMEKRRTLGGLEGMVMHLQVKVRVRVS